MGDRVLDLNDTDRVTVDLRLGGKSFRIARVVMGVRRCYGDLLRETGEALAKVAELAHADSDEVERLSADAEALAERNQDRLFRMLELLLTKNGYEYDREWWFENGDETDLRTFIVSAINKDAPDDQKKSLEILVES